ncbi:hypothetical protein LUW77_15985 [Streptomyces radiopugnans]|nr:hypothetical protein LUW77_15985 [Streptomyces radiopugnans]
MRRHSWVAQLGVLVIHNDPVVEAELWAMAPDGVTVHAARFESPTSGGAEYTGTPWKEMVESPDVRRGLGQLGRMDLSAICLCFGSASFFGGPEFDEGFTAAARELAGGTEVYTARPGDRGRPRRHRRGTAPGRGAAVVHRADLRRRARLSGGG